MVLILTSDQDFLAGMARRLGEIGKPVIGIAQIHDLFERVRQDPVEIIVLDSSCSSVDRMEILNKLRIEKFEGRIISLAEESHDPDLQEASRLGAIQIVGRAFTVDRVMCAIRIALEQLRNDREMAGPL